MIGTRPRDNVTRLMNKAKVLYLYIIFAHLGIGLQSVNFLGYVYSWDKYWAV